MCGSAHTLLPQAACGADLGFGCDALDSVAENGGLQQVVADNASDTEQIARIRSQLQDEAAKFQRGNFSDPAAIHGGAMPGLAELQQGYAQINVVYAELPDGAQIRYTSSDAALVAMLHAWFNAQLSDHGGHAMEHDGAP